MSSRETSWLEVSLIVNGELAEAVAEVLARFAPGGVALESTAIIPDAEGEGFPADTLRVCAYLPVDERLETTRQQLEEALWYLGRISPLPAVSYSTVHEEDWANAWKEHYQPIPIGQRLIIVPAWRDTPAGERIPIRMDPGMAFGTGTHPTTQLCLELIAAINVSPATVIDVGCGSGILSIAALKLGAGCALGVDIDPRAVAISRDNAAANGVAAAYEAATGSVAEIRRGDFALQQADLVIANILAPVIVRLFEDGLAELVAPGGDLILSGILVEQTASVAEAAWRHGMQLVETRQMGDWAALRLQTVQAR